MPLRIKFKFLAKYAEKLPAWLIPTVALFGGSVYLFSDITHDIIWQKEEEVDHKIFKFLSLHVINEPMTKFMKAVTFLASAPFLQVGYGLLIVGFLIPKNYKRCIEIFAIGATGTLLNLVMKWSFHRLRPPDPLMEPLKNFSFPSGHATAGFIFYGLCVYLIWKTDLPGRYKISAGLSLIGLALLIGFSRIYLRMHYPSDVAAGLAVGLAWMVVAVTVMERVKKQAKQETIQETMPSQVGQKTPEITAPLHDIREM